MDHDEFVKLYQEHKITVSINQTKALHVVNSDMLPRRFQLAHIFWGWIWLFSIPVGILLFFIVEWWAGVVVLFGSFLISRAIKQSAMQFLIIHALEDKNFYDFVVSNHIIVVEKYV